MSHITTIFVIMIRYSKGDIICQKAKSDLNDAITKFDTSIFTDEIKKSLNEEVLKLSKVDCSNDDVMDNINDAVEGYLYILIKRIPVLWIQTWESY